jgi:hypothetical protein
MAGRSVIGWRREITDSGTLGDSQYRLPREVLYVLLQGFAASCRNSGSTSNRYVAFEGDR